MSVRDGGGVYLNRDMSVCLRGGDQRLPEIIPPHGRCVHHDQPHMCPNVPARLSYFVFCEILNIFSQRPILVQSRLPEKSLFWGNLTFCQMKAGNSARKLQVICLNLP